MYLSRVQLNTACRETVRAIASPQILHAAIMNALPEKSERSLWRVDRVGAVQYVLLQSHEKPDLTSLSQQFGFFSDAPGETKPYDAFLERLAECQSWRFRLRANPTHSERSSDGSRGTMYPHITVGHQRNWLIGRSEKLGFTLPEEQFDVVESGKIKFRRESKEVTLEVAVYEGILTITDAERFADAMKAGIGRAKAYGCGLLTLARL